MQLIVDHAALRKALDLCGTVRENKTIQILAGVLITAKNDKITIASTDLELTIITTIDAMVRESGSEVISASSLSDICKNADEPLSITTAANGRVDITTGSAKYALPTWPAEDFPLLPDMESDTSAESGSIELSAGEILQMIRTVSYAASVDDSQFAGVFVGIDKKLIEVWSTNRHRFALCELTGKFAATTQQMLPSPLVAASAKLSVSPGATDVRMSWTHSHVGISLGVVTLIGRRPDFRYMPFREMIPSTIGARIVADTAKLATAIKRVVPFAKSNDSKTSRAIRCSFSTAELAISAESAERGKSSDRAMIEHEGEDMLIGYDSRYIGEAIEAVNTSRVELTMDKKHGTEGPTVARPINSDLPFTALHLVMPMRLS